MSQTHRISVTKEQWDEAAANYELGHMHAAQIARELGVSAATVSREFKRRGCVKGCRVGELIAELEARLDADAIEKERRRDEQASARSAAIDTLVNDVMDALMAAEKAGDLTQANSEIARADKALQLAMR